jgi:hypothetical protein
MIGEYLKVDELQNARLVCKPFGNSFLLPLSKKTWIKLNLPLGASFMKQLTKFCRVVRPVILPSSSLKLSVNALRYKSNTMPVNKLIDERNEVYTVREVFEMLSTVKLAMGIGAGWHIPPFVHMWNLIAGKNVKSFTLCLFFAKNMYMHLSEEHVQILDQFENVKQFKISCYIDHKIISDGQVIFNRREVGLLVGKFPNLETVTIHPRNLARSFVAVLNEMQPDNWRKEMGEVSIISRIKKSP